MGSHNSTLPCPPWRVTTSSGREVFLSKSLLHMRKLYPRSVPGKGHRMPSSGPGRPHRVTPTSLTLDDESAWFLGGGTCKYSHQ